MIKNVNITTAYLKLRFIFCGRKCLRLSIVASDVNKFCILYKYLYFCAYESVANNI